MQSHAYYCGLRCLASIMQMTCLHVHELGNFECITGLLWLLSLSKASLSFLINIVHIGRRCFCRDLLSPRTRLEVESIWSNFACNFACNYAANFPEGESVTSWLSVEMGQELVHIILHDTLLRCLSCNVEKNTSARWFPEVIFLNKLFPYNNSSKQTSHIYALPWTTSLQRVCFGCHELEAKIGVTKSRSQRRLLLQTVMFSHFWQFSKKMNGFVKCGQHQHIE